MWVVARCGHTGRMPRFPSSDFICRRSIGGQGLALEAARVVIRYALETVGAEALVTGHNPENVNSKKVMAKLGFQCTHEEFFSALGMNIPYYVMMRRQYPQKLQGAAQRTPREPLPLLGPS
jgi:RimJ/RimL family protein N-acetyltransferase